MLDRTERRILAALAGALLGPVDPPVAETGFLAAVEDVVAGLRARDRRDLGLLLRFIQISPILYFEGRNLTGLAPAGRERHLRRLATSRFGPFRRAVAVAKTLVAFAYYGQQASWPAIGYGGPWVGRETVEKLADPDLGTGA